MMAAVAARELRDGEVVFVGIGLPNLACNLARATHAPNLVLIYESGAVGASPSRLPVSIGDPALVTGSLMVCGMADVFQLFLQNGRIEVGFLGGAQVDRYGNINTTVIGSYERPAVRLPGSGVAAEIAGRASRTSFPRPTLTCVCSATSSTPRSSISRDELRRGGRARPRARVWCRFARRPGAAGRGLLPRGLFRAPPRRGHARRRGRRSRRPLAGRLAARARRLAGPRRRLVRGAPRHRSGAVRWPPGGGGVRRHARRA